MDLWDIPLYGYDIVLDNAEHFGAQDIAQAMFERGQEEAYYQNMREIENRAERAYESPVLYGLMYDDGSEDHERECDDYDMEYPEGFWDDHPE